MLIVAAFASFVSMAYTWTNRPTERIGCTELNGDGCVCHNLERTDDVKVWVTGPQTLEEGQTAVYKMFLAGGPAMAGGDLMAGAYNVAARFGELAIMDTVSILFWGEITQRIPLMFPQVTDTLFWEFSYTAPYGIPMDTIYSTGLSFILEGLPDTDDFWNYGPKYPVRIMPKSTPVELTSFTVSAGDSGNELVWQTASETNNKGFEVERGLKLNEEISWHSIGFVQGSGNTSERKQYAFKDFYNLGSIVYYRLKQTDFDGAYQYSPVVEVSLSAPMDFGIANVYPNPFNPAANIIYTIPSEMPVEISLYSVNGEKIKDLYTGAAQPGTHLLKITAENLSSGIYLIALRSADRFDARKIILAK